MSTLTGLLRLANHLTDGIAVAPPASSGYADAPIAVDTFLSGVGVNNAQLSWGPCSVDWGVMQYAALLDQSGNQIYAFSIPPVTVTAAGDNQVLAPAGTIQVTLGPAWAVNLMRNAAGQILFLASGEPAQLS